MPLLPASGYLTPAAPTVEPSPVPLTPYQDIRAPVEAFGGVTAQALSGFGKSLGEAAGHLENIQSFYDQVVVDEQKNAYENKVNNRMYGDPSVPGDVGYMGLQGKNALEAREGVRKDIDALLVEHRSTLKNANQLRLFNQDASRYRNATLNQVGRHYDEQYNKHAAETADSTFKLKLQEGAVSANNNDFPRLRASLESALVAAEQAQRLRGADEATIKLTRAKTVEAFTATWAVNAIERNAPEGKQFVLDHKDELGDKYDELLHKANAASVQYDVERMKNGLPPVTTQPNLVRGGAVGDSVDKFLDLTAQHESGWRNIPQGLIGPQGGYNPSTGTVTGPSTAQGYYQITNTTWNSFAPGAGVDLAKYSTAMSAPPEVQRQVARHIVMTSGVQHWTDYNARLRASALSVGLPVSGPISGSSTAPAQPTPSAGGDQPSGAIAGPSGPMDVQARYNAAVRSGDTARAQQILRGEAPTAPTSGTSTSTAPAMPTLPPNEPGEFPDGEVPGLLDKLKQGAKLLPPGAKPEVWNAYVRSVRQDANTLYNQQMHAERSRALAQQKADEEIGSQYYERMVPDGTNRPSDAEIRTDKRLSLKMRENLIGALNAPNHPQPSPAVSEANRVEAYQRLGGEVNGKPQLKTTSEIAALMSHPDPNQRITWNQFQSLDEILKLQNNAKRQYVQPHITQLLTDAERVLFPLKHMTGGVGLRMDPDAPTRERRYQLFVENSVQDYITQGKDVRKLFDPGSPDKPNPEYLGSRAILDEFGKGAKQFGRGQANTVFPAEGELKDNPSIMKAYKEGRFGTFGTAEAIEAAKQYSIRAGLGMRRQAVPETGVPMR